MSEEADISLNCPNDTTRRSLLQTLLGFFLVACGATFLGPLFAYLSPRRVNGGKQVLLGDDNRPIRSNDLEGKPYLIGMGIDGEPTIVISYGGELRAFTAVCTHLGCLVKWEVGKSEFLCPCHAGRFDAQGVNIAGPPPKPLKRYRAYITPENTIGLEEKAA